MMKEFSSVFILKCFMYCKDSKHHYLLLEYVSKGTLENFIKNGNCSPEIIKLIFHGLCKALK